MKPLLLLATTLAALLATPAAAQEQAAAGRCIKSESLEGTIRRTQQITEILNIECDRVVTVPGERSTYSRDGEEQVAFEGHLQGDDMLIDRIVFPGQAPIPALRGICIGKQDQREAAMVCSATYVKEDETVGIVAAFGGRPE